MPLLETSEKKVSGMWSVSTREKASSQLLSLRNTGNELTIDLKQQLEVVSQFVPAFYPSHIGSDEIWAITQLCLPLFLLYEYRKYA